MRNLKRTTGVYFEAQRLLHNPIEFERIWCDLYVRNACKSAYIKVICKKTLIVILIFSAGDQRK